MILLLLYDIIIDIVKLMRYYQSYPVQRMLIFMASVRLLREIYANRKKSEFSDADDIEYLGGTDSGRAKCYGGDE
jgi:hypothetical protein